MLPPPGLPPVGRKPGHGRVLRKALLRHGGPRGRPRVQGDSLRRPSGSARRRGRCRHRTGSPGHEGILQEPQGDRRGHRRIRLVRLGRSGTDQPFDRRSDTDGTGEGHDRPLERRKHRTDAPRGCHHWRDQRPRRADHADRPGRPAPHCHCRPESHRACRRGLPVRRRSETTPGRQRAGQRPQVLPGGLRGRLGAPAKGFRPAAGRQQAAGFPRQTRIGVDEGGLPGLRERERRLPYAGTLCDGQRTADAELQGEA
mmetsp:Transcript_17624/g.36245  ORF Transcript_17624/g.36245 Transcript_17624/m.36245 type:complete len:256 (+) Transcript_17624:1105-1872(+)